MMTFENDYQRLSTCFAFRYAASSHEKAPHMTVFAREPVSRRVCDLETWDLDFVCVTQPDIGGTQRLDGLLRRSGTMPLEYGFHGQNGFLHVLFSADARNLDIVQFHPRVPALRGHLNLRRVDSPIDTHTVSPRDARAVLDDFSPLLEKSAREKLATRLVCE